MRRQVKILLFSFIIGCFCVAYGMLNDASTFLEVSSQGFNFERETTSIIETKYISDIVDLVNIDLGYNNIEIVEGDEFSIKYNAYAVDVEEFDNRLIVKDKDLDVPNAFFKIDFSVLYINPFNVTGFERATKLTIPRDVLSELLLNCNSGNITIENQEIDKLIINSRYSNVKLNDINANYVDIVGGSGNTNIDGIVSNDVKIQVDYGNADIKNADIEELNINSRSCNIDYAGLSRTNLYISSDYGNITLDLFGKKEDYNIDIYQSYGNLTIDDDKYVSPLVSKSNNDSESIININGRSGSVKMLFSEKS